MKSYRRKAYTRKFSKKLSKYSKPSKYFVHTSKVDYEPVVVNGGDVNLFGLVASMNQTQDYTALKDLFDEYKILKVRYDFIVENKDSQAGVAAVHGQIYTAIDYNDGDAPTSLPQLEAYKNCKVTSAPRTHIRAFCPKPQQPVYDGLVSAYAPMQPQWLPTKYDNVPHYALKVGYIGGVGTGVSMVIKRIVTYTIAFRGPR